MTALKTLCVLLLARLCAVRAGAVAVSPEPVRRVPGGTCRLVSFPSSLPSGVPVNDTVWLHYYRPVGAGPFPAVVVLHSWRTKHAALADQLCRCLLQHGLAAVLVELPYHLHRKLPGGHSGDGFVTRDPDHTAHSFRQALADIDATVEWLQRNRDTEATRVGLAGISLGAIVGATALGKNAGVRAGVLLLGAADLPTVFTQSPVLLRKRRHAPPQAQTATALRTRWHDIEPLTWLPRAQHKPVLLLNGVHDWVLPRASVEALHAALPAAKVVELPGGHYGGMLIHHAAFELAAEFLAHAFGCGPPPQSRLVTELTRSPCLKFGVVRLQGGLVQPALLFELAWAGRCRAAALDLGVTPTRLLAGVSWDVGRVAGAPAIDLGMGLGVHPDEKPRRYLALSLHF